MPPAAIAPLDLDAAPAVVRAAHPVAEAVARLPFDDDGKAKRGPFRPERLVSMRERQADRLSAHYFRMIDGLVLGAVTLLVAWTANPGGLLEARVIGLAPFALGAAVLFATMKGASLYGFGRREGLARHLGRLALCAGLAGLSALPLGLLGDNLGSAATWMGLASLALGALHTGWWLTVRRWRQAGRLTPNVVIVGANRHAERLILEAMARRDLNVLGVFDDRLARSPQAVAGVPVLGDTAALVGHRIMPSVDRIVLAVDPDARMRLREISSRLSILPNAVSMIVDHEGAAHRDAALSRLAEAPLASLDGRMDDDRRAFSKRLQDLVLGAVAFALLLPVMALTALAVKLDSPGPVFFRQRRQGFNNEEIVVWKFRSMRAEAADARAERQVISGDDRVTRVGRLIRKTSLDELPQLLNVLSGEMSLVGPRPHAIGMKTGDVESARLVAEYAHRHRMKPGMTGWAAVNGSRGPLHEAADVRRRVQLDVDYIERQSFWMDLWIMAVTVPVLLGDRQAVR